MEPIAAALQMDSLFTSLLNVIFSCTCYLSAFTICCSGLLILIGKWNILEKAGENGWAALIPFYGRFCFYEITWDNGWFFLGSYIPGVGYIFDVITKVKLSCRFEKNSVFTLGLVLFEPIFMAILGFDESEYA